MYKPYFIAEIGVNHEANMTLAKKILGRKIKKSVKKGSLIKFSDLLKFLSIPDFFIFY